MSVLSVQYCIVLDIFGQMATLDIFGRRDDKIVGDRRTLDTNVSENYTTNMHNAYFWLLHRIPTRLCYKGLRHCESVGRGYTYILQVCAPGHSVFPPLPPLLLRRPPRRPPIHQSAPSSAQLTSPPLPSPIAAGGLPCQYVLWAVGFFSL